MELSGVKIVDQNGDRLLLASRSSNVDLQKLHRYLMDRGFTMREGPKPPPQEDHDLGLCDAWWLRVVPSRTVPADDA